MSDTPTEPRVMSVPVYCKSRLGLSVGASYRAAVRGDIPVIRLGAKLLVPVLAADKKLGLTE
jgi:hypothetical protein